MHNKVGTQPRQTATEKSGATAATPKAGTKKVGEPTEEPNSPKDKNEKTVTAYYVGIFIGVCALAFGVVISLPYRYVQLTLQLSSNLCAFLTMVSFIINSPRLNISKLALSLAWRSRRRNNALVYNGRKNALPCECKYYWFGLYSSANLTFNYQLTLKTQFTIRLLIISNARAKLG